MTVDGVSELFNTAGGGGAGRKLFRPEDIPVEHLDYGYIRECKNPSEMEVILEILRSGKEGIYPHLIAFAENRLKEIFPKSKLLIPAPKKAIATTEQKKEIEFDLSSWAEQIENVDQALKKDSEYTIDNCKVPLRQAKSGKIETKSSAVKALQAETVEKPKETQKKKTNASRLKSADYDGWSKFDVEKELSKLDEEEVQQREKSNTLPKIYEIQEELPAAKEESLQGKGSAKESKLPAKTGRYGAQQIEVESIVGDDSKAKQQAAALLCDRERLKGNESFRCGSYDEALVYYNRALSIEDSVAVRNNIALIKLKKKLYREVIEDCKDILIRDPDNVKAYLRRATALTEIQSYELAFEDVKRVLGIDPDSSEAKKLMSDLAKRVTKNLAAEREAQGIASRSNPQIQHQESNVPRGPSKRMVIEEVDSEDDDDVDE
eukprot:Nk52_evm25s2340 gene=Nk52_evmTU25s2340